MKCNECNQNLINKVFTRIGEKKFCEICYPSYAASKKKDAEYNDMAKGLRTIRTG